MMAEYRLISVINWKAIKSVQNINFYSKCTLHLKWSELSLDSKPWKFSRKICIFLISKLRLTN